jgi:hypothetical protein
LGLLPHWGTGSSFYYPLSSCLDGEDLARLTRGPAFIGLGATPRLTATGFSLVAASR